MPCSACENPTLCTSRCQALEDAPAPPEVGKVCVCPYPCKWCAYKKWKAEQIAAHVEAGEMEAAKGDERG